MPFGLLAGFGAALAWGTLDVITALASRVIGSLRVTTGMQIVGAAEFALLGLLTGAVLPLDPAAIAVSALLGLIGAAAYLSYFTGLQIGPISVVSGVVAAYGGLTVVLSVVIRGETLTTVQAFGAAVATVGVILTGIAFEGGLRGTRFAGPGVAFAVVALVMFAAMSIVTDIALETIDWLPLMIMARGFNAILSVAILVVLARRGGRSAERPADAPLVVADQDRARDRRGRHARRPRPDLVRDRPRDRADLDGRARLVVRPGGDDHRGGGVPRRTPQAGPVGRARRDPRRDDRDRPADDLISRPGGGSGVVALVREGPHQAPEQPVQLRPLGLVEHGRDPRLALRLCADGAVPDVVTGLGRLDERAAPVVRVGQPADQARGLHPVEPVGHRAAREAHARGELAGRALVGGPTWRSLPRTWNVCRSIPNSARVSSSERSNAFPSDLDALDDALGDGLEVRDLAGPDLELRVELVELAGQVPELRVEHVEVVVRALHGGSIHRAVIRRQEVRYRIS